MKLYVTEDPKNMGKLIEIDIADVIYIESCERSVVFHTMNGEYYPLQPTLSVYEHYMKHHGFERLDRTNLVNRSKIKTFDEDHLLVFFEDPITKNSKYGTVSNSSKRMVKNLLGLQKGN